MFEIKPKEVIPENNKILAWDGYINRQNFAVNTLILHGILLGFSICYLFFVALAGFGNIRTLFPVLASIYFGFLVIFAFIFYSNVVRRVKDFSGDFAIYLSAVFICSLILSAFFNWVLYLLIMLILLCVQGGNGEIEIQNKVKYGICLCSNLILFIIKFCLFHILIPF